ncbi:LysE family transporter [Maribacter sp. 2304DJ31-5]
MIKNYLKVGGAGLLISWLGALPLGTLNITAFDIAASQGVQNAWLFSFSAVCIELLYVRLSLWGSKKWVLEEQWVSTLLLLGALLLIFMAIINFTASTEFTASMGNNPVFRQITSPIVLGVLLSVLNPLQFPFWLAWNKILDAKKILQNKPMSYTSYILGIGLGTLLALSLFIWMGNNLITNYKAYAYYTDKILGLIYLGFSLYLLFMLYKRNLKPITE